MAAVEVISGYKYYGSSKDPNKKVVLDQLDMNVMHGSIYGLLGASGCGKTTLLSCIVGRKKLNKGVINVLGGHPGQPGSGVPGPRVGYMPQDIALLDEFSIAETIIYFGRIYGMNENRIYERYNELSKLLDLPDGDRQVVKCSGGQQRRVSFACALVHEPELLILDEPTVGLDPLLRERIWQYLLETTKTTKLAVIITTHYIEETKMANRVGLMRNGILLAEDSPQTIISLFNAASLEDAFLQLCQKQGDSEEAGGLQKVVDCNPSNNIDSNCITTTSQTVSNVHLHPAVKINTDDNIIKVIPASDDFTGKRPIKRNQSFMEQRPPGIKGKLQITTVPRMKALLSKNILQIVRQPAALAFCFVFPIIQLACFYTAVGGNPKGLKIGIVNEEMPNYQDCLNDSMITAYAHDFTCDFHKISCRFLDVLDGGTLKKVFYNTVEEAYAASRKTDIVGFLHFTDNFTESMQDISTQGRYAQDGSFKSGEIGIRLDMSDQQIAFFVERRIMDTFRDFTKSLMNDCQYPENLASIPMKFEEPVYGSFSDEYTTFIAPGVVMTMVFFLATLGTSTIFITERLEGIWDRVMVAGISSLEMLSAHIITQVVILIIQCAEIIFLAAFIFGSENKGDNFTILALLVLLGFAGMLFGLLISIFCDSHTMASFLATGSFYPMVILCGLLWPLEGMPKFLKYIAMIFPFTIPSISVRNILVKGWSITNFEVYSGFCVLFGWIIVFSMLCVLGLKMTK